MSLQVIEEAGAFPVGSGSPHSSGSSSDSMSSGRVVVSRSGRRDKVLRDDAFPRTVLDGKNERADVGPPALEAWRLLPTRFEPSQGARVRDDAEGYSGQKKLEVLQRTDEGQKFAFVSGLLPFSRVETLRTKFDGAPKRCAIW